MLDLNAPMSTTVKASTPPPPPPSAQVNEEMKPVPDTETQHAVAAPPKGNEPGLGSHLDLYDTNAQAQAQVDKAEKKKKEKAETPKLLGRDTGLPVPTTDPPPQQLPFLKPLGPETELGHALDARV